MLDSQGSRLFARFRQLRHPVPILLIERTFGFVVSKLGPTPGLARFWADQCGSFQTMPNAASGGLGLMQRVVERPGVNKWGTNLAAPLTILGDWNASDAAVTVTVELPATIAAAAPITFGYTPGRITGGAWDTSKPFDSLAAAEEYCIAQPYCSAITFESADKVPTGSLVYWFTSLTDVKPSKNWQSYVVSGPRPAPPKPAPPPPPPGSLGGAWAGVCR